MVKNTDARISNQASPHRSLGIAGERTRAASETVLTQDTSVRPVSGCSIEFSRCIQARLAASEPAHEVKSLDVILKLRTGTRCLSSGDELQINTSPEHAVKAVILKLEEACGHRTEIINDDENFTVTPNGFEVSHVIRVNFDVGPAVFKRAA